MQKPTFRVNNRLDVKNKAILGHVRFHERLMMSDRNSNFNGQLL